MTTPPPWPTHCRHCHTAPVAGHLLFAAAHLRVAGRPSFFTIFEYGRRRHLKMPMTPDEIVFWLTSPPTPPTSVRFTSFRLRQRAYCRDGVCSMPVYYYYHHERYEDT